MVRTDEFHLAAAVRAAGVAQGEAALNIAADLTLRLDPPTARMLC
jgi:hypothetical protein